MIFFLMSFNFSNIERTRNCIFGRSTNWDNLSQGQSDINAEYIVLNYKYPFNRNKYFICGFPFSAEYKIQAGNTRNPLIGDNKKYISLEVGGFEKAPPSIRRSGQQVRRGR